MTWFDLLLIVVLGFSVLFAVVRGAVRELATLGALGLALLFTYLLFSPLTGMLGLSGSFFGRVAVGGVLLVLFFALSFFGFNFILSKTRIGDEFGLADRIGGGVFGAIRGYALIGLSFLGYAYYMDEGRRPEAVNGAVLLPFAKGAAGFIEGFAPVQDSQRIISAEEISAANTNDNDVAPAPITEEGYERGDRAALNEIVTTTTTSNDASNEDSTSIDDALASILSENENSNE